MHEFKTRKSIVYVGFFASIFVVTLTFCAKSSFKSSAARPRPQMRDAPLEQDAPARVQPSAPVVPVTADVGAAPVVVPVTPPPPPPEPVVVPVPPVDPCAHVSPELRNKLSKVLIVDLKSGWFAGDGGDTFRDFIVDQCAGKIKVSYIHLTKKIAEGNLHITGEGPSLLPCLGGSARLTNFDSSLKCTFGSMTTFDQLWLLSGSPADEEDVTLTSPLFSSLLNRAAELLAQKPTSSFFFGAGLGNVDHANALARKLFPVSAAAGLFEVNSINWNPGTAPDRSRFKGTNPLYPGSGTTSLTFDASAPVFRGLTVLFDHRTTRTFGQTVCFGDNIINRNVKIIGTNSCAKPVIGTATMNGHKVYLESTMSRFYGTNAVDYFNRIVGYLLN